MLLYADEDFPYPVVEELRRLGHDVLTVQEDGRHASDVNRLDREGPERQPARRAVRVAAGHHNGCEQEGRDPEQPGRERFEPLETDARAQQERDDAEHRPLELADQEVVRILVARDAEDRGGRVHHHNADRRERE